MYEQKLPTVSSIRTVSTEYNRLGQTVGPDLATSSQTTVAEVSGQDITVDHELLAA